MSTVARFAPWLIFLGNVALLSGLAWDARLHGLDPTLAMREGVFTMSNPGHILFAAGVALVVAGSVLLLLSQALRRSGSTLARRAVAVVASLALVVLSALTFTTAVAGQAGEVAAHVHAHAAPEMADSGHHHPAPSASPAPGAQGAPPPTPEQQAAANQLLADVRKDAAAFADVNAAVAAGYVQSTRWSLLNWGAAHFTNFTYSRDGRHLDTGRPESLVYLRLPSGKVVLLGVMFSAPKGEGPRPGGPLTDWHTHDNLCISATGAAVLATAPGQCPAGAFFVGERVEMMHIWTFNHPEGPFAHMLNAEAFRAAVQQFRGR